MKPLNQYIKEKLIINKDYVDVNMLTPKSFDELRKIIDDRYNKLGPGTKQNPIDFNDIDVSNLDSFCNKYDIGLFYDMNFKHIDISKWNVSKVTDMSHMFCECKSFNQDLSSWNVSSVTDMRGMFARCLSFNKGLSNWDVSNVTDMENMFYECENFNQDISKWNVKNVTNMGYMFYYCKKFNQDLSDWGVSNVRNNYHIFHDCPIKRKYKPKFKK